MEFDPLFDLAEYANLNEEERNMYNQSLKRKWDHENIIDYAIENAVAQAEQKAEKEKKEIVWNIARNMAAKLKIKGMSSNEIAEITGLTIDEITAV